MAVFYLSSTSSASRLLKIIAQIKRKDKLQILITNLKLLCHLSTFEVTKEKETRANKNG